MPQYNEGAPSSTVPTREFHTRLRSSLVTTKELLRYNSAQRKSYAYYGAPSLGYDATRELPRHDEGAPYCDYLFTTYLFIATIALLGASTTRVALCPSLATCTIVAVAFFATATANAGPTNERVRTRKLSNRKLWQVICPVFLDHPS